MVDDLKRVSALSLTRIAALALALSATGCTVYHAEIDGLSEGALAELGGGPGIPLQVDGVVGGVRGAALAAAVGAGMPTTIDSKTVRYAPCEPFTECAGDHIVWTFGPPEVRPASVYPPAFHFDLNWIGDYQPASNNIAAKISLFQGGTVVSSAAGQIDAPNGVNDPAFRAMIAEMSRAVLVGSPLDFF